MQVIPKITLFKGRKINTWSGFQLVQKPMKLRVISVMEESSTTEKVKFYWPNAQKTPLWEPLSGRRDPYDRPKYTKRVKIHKDQRESVGSILEHTLFKRSRVDISPLLRGGAGVGCIKAFICWGRELKALTAISTKDSINGAPQPSIS